MTNKLLKLFAKDAEDIQVISAVLQDSIAPICDMLYRPEEKNFVMVLHRLRREVAETGMERICCAVNVSGVAQVQFQGFHLNEQGRMLDLLALVPEEGAITFVFAGNAKIRLHLAGWSALIEDFGEPWPSHCTPCHDSDAAAI